MNESWRWKYVLRWRCFVDFSCGDAVFVNFFCGVAVFRTPPCPPRHVAKVKAVTSLHSFNVFIIPFDKTKRIYFTHNKENNIRNIVCVLMFQQLLSNKNHRLRDSKFGREKVWVWSPTKLKKQDLLDLITAILKFNCFLSTTVAMQCTFQSSPW